MLTVAIEYKPVDNNYSICTVWFRYFKSAFKMSTACMLSVSELCTKLPSEFLYLTFPNCPVKVQNTFM